MRKIIKLIVLIAVVALVFIAVIFLPQQCGPGSGSSEGGNGDYERLSEKVSLRWKHDNATWLLADYNNLVAEIDVYIGGDKHSTLRQLNASGAAKVLRATMMTAFEQDASEARLDELKGDVEQLKKDPINHLGNNANITECEGTYKLYKDILRYGRTNFSFSPGLKVYENSVTFTKLSEHENRVDSQRKSLTTGSQYYNSIKNRNDVKGALRDAEQKLKTERENYPNKVADAIKNEFNKRDYTQENLDLLDKACKAFSNEFSGNNSLVGYRNTFESKVNNSYPY